MDIIKLKFLFISFLMICVFGAGIYHLEKNLENFFFWQLVAENPRIIAYQTSQFSLDPSLRPLRKKEMEDFESTAKSVISVLVNPEKNWTTKKILFQKSKKERLPIASLTKTMTASIVLDNYSSLDEKIEISWKAVSQEGMEGYLRIGEHLTVKELLYIMLLESSNDAAFALTEKIEGYKFIGLMNSKAKKLQLKNTHFVNPTGLDPDFLAGINSQEEMNYSTTADLTGLTKDILENSSLVTEILSLPEFQLFTSEGFFHHHLRNTNILLKEYPEALWGKTGYTEKAQGCLLFIIEAPNSRGIIINIVLGAEDRFEEMRRLIDWLKTAYDW